MSIAQLKDALRANDLLLSGSKPDLIARIEEAMQYGCPPRCTSCGGGRLKRVGGSQYKCPGFYDDDHYRHCHAYYSVAMLQMKPFAMPAASAP